MAVPHFTGGHSPVPGAQLPGSVTFTVALHTGMTASVMVTMKVDPPPAVLRPKGK